MTEESAPPRPGSRFVQAFGESLDTSEPRLRWLFPHHHSIATRAPEEVAALGIVGARARAIVLLAREVASARLRLDPSAPLEATIAALERLPGIGAWTAQYIAMRALSWPDAFPHHDVAVLKAMKEPSAARALQRAEAWRPWRAYSVLHLWKSLESPP